MAERGVGEELDFDEMERLVPEYDITSYVLHKHANVQYREMLCYSVRCSVRLDDIWILLRVLTTRGRVCGGVVLRPTEYTIPAPVSDAGEEDVSSIFISMTKNSTGDRYCLLESSSIFSHV